MDAKKNQNKRLSWLSAIAIALVLCVVGLLPSEGSVSFASLGWAQQPGLPVPPPLKDKRFGVVQAYNAPEAATAAGVGWTRVLFFWHQVQPFGLEHWNEDYLPDEIIAAELTAGRELVGIVLGTPPWASQSRRERAVPSGLYLPYNHPDNVWGQAMARIVARYKGKIDHWIIWNEPDVWEDANPGKTWNGTVEDYVQLLKVGYQAAKAANPEAVVLLTATTYWHDAEYGRPLYFPRLLAAIKNFPDAAAHNYFFDIASAHLYFKPEQIYDITILTRQQLDQYGFADKPLWINETNAPPSHDPLHPATKERFHVTLEEQGHFLIQVWAVGLAAGAERVSFYKMRDGNEVPVGFWPFGIQRKDGSVRPVFWSYRTLVTYLSGYQSATLSKEGTIRRVVIPRGELGITTVLWNMGTRWQTIQVPASSNSALLVDAFGPVETLTPTSRPPSIPPNSGGEVGDEGEAGTEGGRYYTLQLPPSRNGEIGGRPYLIVEGAGADIHLERPTTPDIPPALVYPAPARPLPALAPEGSDETSQGSGESLPIAPSPTPIIMPSPTSIIMPSPTFTIMPSPTAPPVVPDVGSEAPPIVGDTEVIGPFPPPREAPLPELAGKPLPNGYFFTQGAYGEGGYSVVDDAQARFWSEYKRLGGAETIGYPISRRYQQDGFITQAFQKLILQWRPDRGQAWGTNLFDDLSTAGLDQYLLNAYNIPPAIASHEIEPPNGSWPEIVNARQRLLHTNGAIYQRYFSAPNPLTLFGLPTSRLEDMGDYVAIRTQRVVFLQWKESGPSTQRGEVTIANGGLIAKELGWLPVDALLPESR